MRSWAAAAAFCLLAITAAPSSAADPSKGIGKGAGRGVELVQRFRPSEEPVSLDQIWKIAPELPNPHRARWVLERKVRLQNPPIVAVDDAFRVRGGQVISDSVLHLRTDGPWYRALREFRCAAQADDWFATREGSRVAGEAGAQEWDDLLRERRAQLELRLGRIRETSRERAEARAQLVFLEWLADAEGEFAVRGRNQARMAEWRWYLHQAAQARLCDMQHRPVEPATGARRELPPAPTWAQMLPATPAGADPQLLARAPARRVNGMYAVRLSIEALGHTLDGLFLVDTGAAQSALDPDWLESQGVNPALIERPGQRPQRISWTGGTGLARVARVEQATLAGRKLGLTDFLIVGTRIFGPPEQPRECCDGILGADLLREYVVELAPGATPALQLWARDGFHPPASAGPLAAWERAWAEVQVRPGGDLMSEECAAHPAAKAGATKSSLAAGPVISGIRWDTGDETALDIHQPWQAAWRKSSARGKPWRVDCRGDAGYTGLTPTTPTGIRSGSPFQTRMPGATIGVEALSRGRVYFDLPHGKLWLTPPTLQESPRANRTGITLRYREEDDGSRTLRVAKLGKEPVARRFAAAGLKVGMRIASVNGASVADLDQWEVDRRLAGAIDPRLRLGWNDPMAKTLEVPLK
jgi:hypothetical protein